MSDSPFSQPDKADINAVRNFLPGKVLGRVSALLFLLCLVLAAVDQANSALEKIGITISPPALKMAVLFGLPVLAIFWQLALEAIALRRQRQAKRLALTNPQVPAGYFRIGPYEKADLNTYRRADQAHIKALSWIQTANVLPLYITGDSGSGKSSLLNAYVLPQLRQMQWTVCEARAYDDPELALRQALSAQIGISRSEPLDTEPSTRQLIETVANASVQRLLIVLDQFEEFIIIAKPAAREAFAVMCQHYSGHKVKQIYTAIQNPRVTDSH